MSWLLVVRISVDVDGWRVVGHVRVLAGADVFGVVDVGAVEGAVAADLADRVYARAFRVVFAAHGGFGVPAPAATGALWVA